MSTYIDNLIEMLFAALIGLLIVLFVFITKEIIEDNRIIERRFISSGVDVNDLPFVMQRIRECKRSIAQELLNTTMY